jgi:hypothetical protein
MFKSSVKFVVGGREVSASEAGNAFKESVMAAAKERLRGIVESVNCPVHGRPAQVASVENSGTRWTYSVHGCCDALKEEVERVMSRK